MTVEHLSELARQWVVEQGEEAGAHLAQAIRELREVGDTRGAALLAKIAQKIDQIDDDAFPPIRRSVIRRHR